MDTDAHDTVPLPALKASPIQGVTCLWIARGLILVVVEVKLGRPLHLHADMESHRRANSGLSGIC